MILCPKCNNRLSITKDGATCGQHEFLYRDNILELEKSEYYYGEIPQNEMNELLSMIRTEGFFKAVAGYLNCQPQWKSDYLYRYIFSPQRISWLFMTSLRQRRRVLDFGCGWGTLLIPLAKIFDKVIGIDICRERLEFASIRAKEEGIQNIIFVQSGTNLSLPFENNAFDLVILNGVLEWIPESFSENPREVQKIFLKEIRRILSPNGELYIGIENRFAYTYLLGAREDHTGLRFGAILPRPLANIYSVYVRKKPYRTYTYSQIGYRRLLKEVGFNNTKIYPVIPNYRFPRLYFYPFCGRYDRTTLASLIIKGSNFKQKVKRCILAAIFHPKIVPYLSHSFSIISSNDKWDSFLEQALFLSGYTPREIVIGSVSEGNNLCIVAKRHDKDEGVVLKFPLSKRAEERLIKGAKNATMVKNLMNTKYPEFCKLIPSEEIFQLNDIIVSRANLLPGKQILIPRDRIAQVNEFITIFHSLNTKSVIITSQNFNSIIGISLEQLLSNIEFVNRELSMRLKDMVSRAILSFSGMIVNIGICHGDFHHGNLLFKNGKLSGVLDWCDLSEAGLQAIDGFHFQIMRKAFLRGCSASEILLDELKEVHNLKHLFLIIVYLLKTMHALFDLYNMPYIGNALQKTWFQILAEIENKLRSVK